ncbi:putative helicase mov-10-B.1 isoform X2 [Diabrotica virgifera virgifera]|uniref:RNA helicase n=1 Tax=Diabrotica virgifera virgifera TaxID=50390 RepID=A0A6P7FP28_DIAVI|nr:putative helicase mov-10-B.1 isoform X2 [Diabrotica virgifera virgifera]
MALSVLEDYVKDLLKENIIQNYTAQKETAREFYFEKYRQRGKLSFFKFKKELWKYWYVNSYTSQTIKFNEQWINYFAVQLGENSLNKEPFNEQTYINDQNCSLCNVIFNNPDEYKSHLEWMDHQIRLSYVKNKSIFKNNNEIKAVLICNEEEYTEQKLQVPVKTDMQTTLRIQNVTNKKIEILKIIQINTLQKHVSLQKEFVKGIPLEPSATVDITIRAYFEHSESLVYPILLLTRRKRKSFHLITIEVESVSEFSFLKSNSKNYVSPIPDAYSIYSNMKDNIVPGQKLEEFKSHYTEKLPLKHFKIPDKLEEIFKKLLTRNPEFGMRAPTHYKKFSRELDFTPGIDETNYFISLEKLLHIEENQFRIDIRNYDTTSTLEKVKGKSLYKLEVPGLAEARPSILRNDKIYLKENKTDSYKYEGRVHQIFETSVHLGLNKTFDEIFINNKKFHIEFGFNRRSIRVEKQALFLAHTHGIIPYLFPKELRIEMLPEKDLVFSDRTLNEEQKVAVKNIVKCRNTPFIIFGPPGTGKTITVVESVYQIWKKYPKSRILICAPSNAATNEVAVRLRKIIPKSEIFRLIGITYANSKTELQEIKDIVNLGKDNAFYEPAMEELLKYRILLTTVVTSARLVNGGVPSNHFSHIFIDESGYATETQTLIPIAGISSTSENKGMVSAQLVLAGDPKQLGPLVHSGFAEYCGYGKSMLERLIYNEVYSKNESNSFDNRCVTKLIRNYRSHESIIKPSSKLFYNNELIAAGNPFTDLFIGSDILINKKFPVIFHNVEGEDKRDETSPSFYNVQEIEQTAEYISKLFSNKVKGMAITEDHIGVIAPYRKQVEKLKQACARKKWSNLLIGSVEQFQGKEKLIIIISTVRSKNTSKFEDIDKMCNLGFLTNPKRFNVALTRAKALLIVIGNATVLKTDSNWSHFIQYCSENKSTTGKPFN